MNRYYIVDKIVESRGGPSYITLTTVCYTIDDDIDQVRHDTPGATLVELSEKITLDTDADIIGLDIGDVVTLTLTKIPTNTGEHQP